MILCSCANIPESVAREKLKTQTLSEFMIETNCAMQCGSCWQDLLDIADEYDNRSTRVISHSTTPGQPPSLS